MYEFGYSCLASRIRMTFSARIWNLFCSVVDPDPHLFWAAGSWIRIGNTEPGGSGSRRAKMTHKSEENSRFEVLDEDFCSFDVLYGGLGISKFQFLIQK